MVATLNERVPTGVAGLDTLIEGGFLRGDFILVAGKSGSGKTIFSTQFIYDGAVHCGEKGIYASFEEDAKTLKRNMLKFGFDLDKLEKEGMIKVIDLEALQSEGLSANLDYILKMMDEFNAKRLVIDSLTAFLSGCSEKFEYRAFMHLIYRMLKMHDYTTVMTCSIPTGVDRLGLGIEEFIADSLMLFENEVDGLELKTRLVIRKMRGTNHSKKLHNVIVSNKGLQIVPFAIT